MLKLPKSLFSSVEIPEGPLDPARRRLVARGLAAGALLMVTPSLRPAYASFFNGPARTISLTNSHTGEQCTVTYWEGGDYVEEALVTVKHLLRDHRNDAQHDIDPTLLDLLAMLHEKLETNAPFDVISGYRSPATNAMLHARSSGVAKHSLHMSGKAVDIRVAGRALSAIHQTALAMGLGGVGYYPSSNFVHVDTGRVRQWSEHNINPNSAQA